MAEQHVSQKEFGDYGLQVQGQITALIVAINTLLDELAPTEEARQSIKKAMEKAATDPSRIPSVVQKSVNDTIARILPNKQ